MPKRKTDFAMGLETILNNPQTSFLTNPKTFSEIHSQSKMPLTSMIKTIGRGAKNNKQKAKEPTDEEKSEARLSKMEAKSETK
jgi:hypothetical protein